MGAIYAEIHVDGHVFPLLSCTYGVHQATDPRGRVVEGVRFDGAQLRLDVPRVDVLKVLANDPAKRLPIDIIFRESAGGAATETLSFKAAYCVFYKEDFQAGSITTGSFIATVHLSDPDGFTMLPGGPASTAVAPAARDHGAPLPVIPLVAGIGPAGWADSKKMPAWNEEHKAARWAEYQRDHAGDPKAYGQARWDKSYETGRNNNIKGLARERKYAAEMGATSAVLKTKYTLRQIDMFVEKDDFCGQLKTGKIYLGKQEKEDLRKDRALIRQRFKVEYILEKGASKPFLAALDAIGATYKIGPQIS